MKVSRARKQNNNKNSLLNLNNLSNKSSQNSQSSQNTLISIHLPEVVNNADQNDNNNDDNSNIPEISDDSNLVHIASTPRLTFVPLNPSAPTFVPSTNTNRIFPTLLSTFNVPENITEENSNRDEDDTLTSLTILSPVASQETVIDINDPNSAYTLRNQAAFADRINNDTLLVDIPPEEFGIFTGCSSSISFIPEKHLKKTRNVYSFYLNKVADNNTVDNYNWLKLILLPIILFDNSKTKSKEIKNEFERKLNLLAQDDWSTFTIGSLSKKNLDFKASTKEQIHASATRLIESGEIGKAFKRLNSDPNKVAPTREAFETIRSKFSEQGESCLSEEAIESIYTYSLESDNRDIDKEPIVATQEDISNILKKAKKLSAHGLDRLRYEHLIQLWVAHGSDDPNVAKFRDLFTKIINFIIQAQVPANIKCIFQDHTLIALPKPNNDIRPIGLQLVLKKIACKVALKATKKFNVAYFDDGLQYCLDRFGTESVSLFFRAAQQSMPSNDFWSLDGDNGFGRISRVVGLFQTKKKFPWLLPLLKMIYGNPSNAWYFGLKTGIESINSEEGIQQGDVLSMWFYAMSIHPLLQKLKDILGPEGFTKWYADDGYVNAPFEKMIQVIEAVQRLGPKVGYYVKISKGTYLLGKCSDLETAIYRKNQLIGLGLDESTIIIHPENDPSTQNTYGCRILGSFIGTDDYIRTQLDLK